MAFLLADTKTIRNHPTRIERECEAQDIWSFSQSLCVCRDYWGLVTCFHLLIPCRESVSAVQYYSLYLGPAANMMWEAPWYPWPVPRCLPMIWSHNRVKSQLMRRICLAPWHRQDKDAWCLLMVQSKTRAEIESPDQVCSEIYTVSVWVYHTWMWDMIHSAEVRRCQFTWNSEQTLADLARLGWAHVVECGDFEACKIPQLANMGIKRGLPAWDCAMSIPHTQIVWGGPHMLQLISAKNSIFDVSLYLICLCNPNFVREIDLALHSKVHKEANLHRGPFESEYKGNCSGIRVGKYAILKIGNGPHTIYWEL